MTTAVALSIAFVMYVAYHMTADSTKFWRWSYQICVLFYITSLSIIIIPLVLITYVRA
jgi:putative membrane protein